MKFKLKLKRILAGMLGVVMTLGLMPTSAFAASAETGVASFSYSYQSDGTDIRYWDSFTADGYSTGDTTGTIHRLIIYMNGEEAYCIEPGVHLRHGDQLSADASERWNALDAKKQNGVKTVLAFGKPGNSANIGGSEGSQSAATQMLVWEMVCGIRDPETLTRVDDRIINSLCAGGHNSEVLEVYNNIVAAMTNFHQMPSFADGSTKAMTYENGQYVLRLTDTNGVLSDCSVSASDSRVQITMSGNTLTLTSKDYFDGDVRVNFVKSTNISANAQLVAWGSPDLQDVITGIEKPEDVTASLKVTTPGGNLNIRKTSEDGRVAGITMTISGQNFNQTVKTDANGNIQLKGLVPGTYTVTEQVSDYYEPQQSKSITVTAGKTAEVSFHNVLKKGTVSVAKNSEDQFHSGIQFRLFGTSASGQEINLYATTNEAGIATLENVLIAGQDGYTLEEVDTAARYVIPKDQTIHVFWQEETNTVVTNTLKKFNVTVNKADGETAVAQGDATLSGAVYGLYDSDTLVEKLVTDEDGHATSGYYVCGDEWTVKEISPSEGYMLDETVYSVGASAGNFEVEFSSAPDVNSDEQVIKGQISIIKHHDDGATQIETPEEGATFEVYLTSAGSFEAARDSEKDVLICDADGFAMSKKLPYGVYTVHQTAGAAETEFMKDFTVFVSQNGQNYKYLINNAPYTAYLKVTKADAETGNTIPLSGAGFEIYDADGQKVEMKYTYPTLTVIDRFYVSDDGTLLTPEVLPAGNYTLVEVQAPYGYVLDSTPIPFTVTTSSDNEEMAGLNVITVTAYDMAQKGVIRITKNGEVFSTVNMTGDEVPADKEGKTTTLINCVYTPVYEEKALAGATYQVIAAEDIYTGDGTLRVAAGTVVDEITTGEDGSATTKEFYLGRYSVVETKAPDGFVLNSEAQTVALTYAGQEISLTSTDAGFVNDRQKVSVDAEKIMEQSENFNIGMNHEVAAVSFGLYAAEEIVAADGSVIPMDGLIEITFADHDGHVAFAADLPFGHYYVKELSTNPYYAKDDTEYAFHFEYAGQEIAIQEIHLNQGEAIVNKLMLGRIEGVKVDANDAVLANAEFGLFAKDTTDFTKENALLTATTDADGRFAFDEVPLGDYVVVELEAPEGYVLSDARHFVCLTYDGQVIGLKAIDYPITGNIELTKYDAEHPENHLSGAVFKLYADTDKNGEFNITEDQLISVIPEANAGVYRLEGVAYGNYFVHEEEAPEGFLKDDNTYPVSIVTHGETVVVENEAGIGFKNSPIMGEVEIFKSDKSGSKLVGAGFRIFDADGQQVADGVTDENGTVHFNLRYGKYTVREYKAPEGYVLADTPLAFEIKENGQKLTFDMENLKIKGKLVISKADADTEELLPNAGFRIYDVDGKVVKEGYTDSKGICEFELEFGKYCYQEFDAPDGYQIDDTKYEFSIKENGEVVSVVMTNKKAPSEPTKPTETPKTEKTDSPKTGDDSNINLWTAVAALAAAGGFAALGFYFRNQKKRKDE